MMTAPQVTIVVVPRERFSYAIPSLQNIYENTDYPFSLVYVDGGSPAYLKRYLQVEARLRGFRLIQTDHYLSPNQARNIGLKQVETKYVVFVDNDVLVSPGWLQALVRCAEETGAWAVGPLYLEGEMAEGVIHMAGSVLQVKEENGRRILFEKHRFNGRRVSELAEPLRRGPCDVIEFHTMLVRTEIFDQIGEFDERLLNTREHVDFCLAVREAGGAVMLEPRAVVTFIAPPPFAWSDVPFYMLRWSEAWSRASLDHFNRKWNMSIDHHHMTWIRNRRRELLRPLHSLTSRVFGWRADHIERALVHPVERALNCSVYRMAWSRKMGLPG
jgi:GT2 family glycosyltransferase